MDAALSDPSCSTPNINACHSDFTWTSCPFSSKMCGEKIAVKHIPFFRLNFFPPYGTWTQLYLILAVLLPIFTHVTAILHEQVVRFPQKCAEKKLQRSTRTPRSPICFNAICCFCGIVRRYLRKKIATCKASATCSVFFRMFLRRTDNFVHIKSQWRM